MEESGGRCCASFKEELAMALIINNNLMAANASRNLGGNYNKLAVSIQRLSSGLRINSAADDAAGLAIREMMRADIAVTQQGIRNAADAVSMIQTADGALGVIDEKLTRMKELAEQAATGTYTTVQRDIINSEYQQMAREIDRIASATNFNGLKLLDGSINQQHGGQGVKIHFGLGNKAAEDYYFVNLGDARATSSTGLRVGGDARNDVWAQGGATALYGQAAGCCAGGFESLNGADAFTSGQVFAYGYNWDWQGGDGDALLTGRYTAGLYQVNAGDSLQDLVDKVNAGTQSRVGIRFGSGDVSAGDVVGANMSAFAVCVGNEAYVWGSSAAAGRELDSTKTVTVAGSNADANMGQAFTSAVNHNAGSQFWAVWDGSASTVYVFAKDGGDNNNLTACEQGVGMTCAAVSVTGQLWLSAVSFLNVASNQTSQSGANFSLGGEKWASMRAVQSKGLNGEEVWNVVLSGRDVGRGRNLWIADVGDSASDNFSTAAGAAMRLNGMSGVTHIGGMGQNHFIEVQNADNAPWRGAEIRTQSSAQEALDALSEAILQKDKIRADLGAVQNRLENTMTQLEIQGENLLAAESRISDVDMAREMTEFTKNNILVQAGVGMLAQANSMAQLALSLL
jgi:flagellin